VFVGLHRSRDRLEEIEQIDAWLYRVARNVLIDHIRALNARREIPVSGRLDIPDMPEDPADVGAADARAELSSCVRPMLETLPDEQRVAIELTDLGQLTQREAAEQLGVSVSGVKSRVQRGRQRMRAELNACCMIALDARGAVIDHEPRNKPRSDC
jgi:RNA polymerase sigma-70 factor (ECF subfamily)